MDELKKPELSSDEQNKNEESLEKSPRIHSKEALIVTREDLPKIIEEPCLGTCYEIFDKNIRTVASNGNEVYAMLGSRGEGGLFIHIDYNSLSGENKRIAHELESKGLVRITTGDSYGGIDEKVIIESRDRQIRASVRPVYDIREFEEQSLRIAEMFQNQDVLYGRYKPEEVVQQILDAEGIQDKETGGMFLLQNNILTENGLINLEGIVEFLSNKNDRVIIDDPKHSYRTINFGKVYDEETGEFWANEELLLKHRKFIAENGIPLEEDYQGSKIIFNSRI